MPLRRLDRGIGPDPVAIGFRCWRRDFMMAITHPVTAQLLLKVVAENVRRTKPAVCRSGV